MSEDRGRHATLVVPGLFGPAMPSGPGDVAGARLLTEGLSLPSLERFFCRSTATASDRSEHGLAALLFGCFGVSREGPDWPVAAVTRRLDGVSADGGWWLRADPVHLRADMGELVLLAAILIMSTRLIVSAHPPPAPQHWRRSRQPGAASPRFTGLRLAGALRRVAPLCFAPA